MDPDVSEELAAFDIRAENSTTLVFYYHTHCPLQP
jgi:hypothetical protein